jgi:hypothetical protein
VPRSSTCLPFQSQLFQSTAEQEAEAAVDGAAAVAATDDLLSTAAAVAAVDAEAYE